LYTSAFCKLQRLLCAFAPPFKHLPRGKAVPHVSRGEAQHAWQFTGGGLVGVFAGKSQMQGIHSSGNVPIEILARRAFKSKVNLCALMTQALQCFDEADVLCS
jgi:hypothetical protein